MGNKQIKKKTNNVNQQIETHMLQSHDKQKKTYDIVLYGINSSGKTTILKTLNSRYNELASPPNIVSNIRSQCVNNMIKLCTMFDEAKSDALQKLNVNNPEHLSSISEIMQNIWKNTDIKSNYDHRYITNQQNMDIIDDNLDYFFDKIEEIMTKEYTPTETDIIYHKTAGNGIMDYLWTSETNFGAHIFKYIDMGNYTQNMSNLIKRNKMKYIFENVAGFIFVVSICDYCNKTRMLRSLQEFRNIVNAKLLDSKMILIFFNKYKIFKDCLRKGVSLKNSFAEYDGNEYINYLLPICAAGVIRNMQSCIDNIIPDIVSQLIKQYIIEDEYLEMEKDEYFELCENDAVKYIAAQYLKVFEGMNANLTTPMHIHRTHALDGDYLDKVFRDIQLDTIKTNLRNFS